jgi:hypothetical protein
VAGWTLTLVLSHDRLTSTLLHVFKFCHPLDLEAADEIILDLQDGTPRTP